MAGAVRVAVGGDADRPMCSIIDGERLGLGQVVPETGTMHQADLATFLHLAASGSLSATSRVLREPKSSVSRSLARLEATLGVALFDRSTRHFRLTDAGLLLRPYAERVLHELEEARSILEGTAAEPAGLLRINTTPTFAQELIAPILPGLIRRYPRLQVELDVDRRRIDLLHEGVDLVIRVGNLSDSSLIARRLPPIATWMVASPDYLERKGMPSDLSDLADHDVVTRDASTRWTFENDGVKRTIETRGRIVIPDAATQRVVIKGGGGIGCLAKYLVEAAVDAGDLVRVLPQWQRPPIEIHAVYPSHRSMSAKVRVFIDALVAHTSV
jgi:DNA-binding transcriptional LysR family regulator